MPYSLRRRRKIVAALKLPRPESVQTEIEERGVSIQKARRKRTHDIDNLAIIHVSSCIDVLALQEMSLATFRLELGLHSMCMSRLHALYFMLRTSYSTCACTYDNLLASQDVFIRSYIHLMSTTQLDRSRSPTMPCIHLVANPRRECAARVASYPDAEKRPGIDYTRMREKIGIFYGYFTVYYCDVIYRLRRKFTMKYPRVI